jgi:hydroxyacylglutathione hydrolase
MILEQHYLACLSQASYLIVDERTKTAAVVDPRRDVQLYLDRAADLGVTIRHVLLTHFHADFLAGHLELQKRTGATIWLGAAGRAEYEASPMEDGGSLEFGDVRLGFLATPGHTPESTCITVFDLAKDREHPHAVLTGDTLFIGDVGRPDLLVSAGMEATDLGGMLFDSLRQKLLTLPDETIVYPGHGAGSACGKNLSSDTSSTIGRQRATNYALQPMEKDEFVRLVASEQPRAPGYFAHDAVLNRKKHATLDQVLDGLKPLPLEAVLAAVNGGAALLDTRAADEFALGHVSGSINIGLGGRFASWAGTMLPASRKVVLLTSPGDERESALRLGRIGFDHVAGYLQGGIAAVEARPELLSSYTRLTPQALEQRLSDSAPPLVVDIRTPGEWNAGHIDTALHVELDDLPRRLDEIPRDRDLVVVCRGGYRSSIGASLLEGAGYTKVTDLVGGMDAYAVRR